MTVRRVGFRFGTDDELAAMHTVESEIGAERRPGTAPQPLAAYVAFARSLPSQFADHTWVADSPDGAPAGCAACWSDAAGDADVMECYVYVRARWRTQGVGWNLARAVVDEAKAERASRLVWATFDRVPAGEAFSRRVGGAVARVNRTSELTLDDVDWALVRSWADDCAGQAAGYTLEFWDGPFPAELLDDAAHFHHIMQTAPRDELDVGDITLDAGHVAEIDRHLVASGRRRWTIFVRDPAGTCVGGTELTFEAWDPTVAMQQNTGIDPAHRGRGLAKWAKASMLERVKLERRAVTVIRTGNAFSNAPMLAINDTLGFEVVEVRTEWQGEIDALHRALGGR